MTLPLPFGISLLNPPPPSAPDRREFLNGQNLIENSRAIDPVAGDYILSANGGFEGMDAITQQVYLCCVTQLGTAAVLTFGNDALNLKLNSGNLKQKVLSLVSNALQAMIQSGEIALNGVNVLVQPQGVLIMQVFFTNLITFQPVSINIPIS
jgi:hypothetical protein